MFGSRSSIITFIADWLRDPPEDVIFARRRLEAARGRLDALGLGVLGSP